MNEYERLLSDAPPCNKSLYHYGTLKDLTPPELLFCVMAEETCNHFGVPDVAAVTAIILGYPFLRTRAKPGGSTIGTSVVSLICRELVNIRLKKNYLPAITGTLLDLRVSWTNHLGAFVGRQIPMLGWVVGIYDVVSIVTRTTAHYNRLVEPEDRINDITAGTLG